MSENDPALDPDAGIPPAPAENKPAKKAAAKKAVAPAPSESTRGEKIKYVYSEDESGNVTSLVAFGSEGALFDYVRQNRQVAVKFIDVPKGDDVIAAIKADA